MAQFALGNVQPNSSTVGLPATQNAPALLNQQAAALFSCQALQFQVLAANTGSVFICDRAQPDLTMNVYVEIPAPTTSPPSRPAWTIGDPTQRVPFNAAAFFIVPQNPGEGVRVTAIRQPVLFHGPGATTGVLTSILLMLSYWLGDKLLSWLR